MQEFRIGQVAELLGVSPDTVRRWADAGDLPFRRSVGGQRLVAGTALAAFVVEHAPTSELGSITAQSARNRFPGLVTRVVRDTVMAQVEIQAGPHRIVSLISAEAVDDLGLEPGVRAVATIKATNVVIEKAG